MNERARRALLKGGLSLAAFESVIHLTGDPRMGSAAAAVTSALEETLVPPIDKFAVKYLRPAKVFDRKAKPLHVRLGQVTTADSLKAMLKSFNRRSETTSALENSLRVVALSQGQSRLEQLLDILVGLVVNNLGCTEEWIHVAAAVLTRFAPTLGDSSLLKNFYDNAANRLECIDAACVPTIECLAYTCMVQDRPALYYNNIRRYVTDLKWRTNDAHEGDCYYGSESSSLNAVVYHYRHRAVELHVHDLARVIHLYGLLRHSPDDEATAILAKQGMLEAILPHDDLGHKFMGQVEDMIEKRHREIWPEYRFSD